MINLLTAIVLAFVSMIVLLASWESGNPFAMGICLVLVGGIATPLGTFFLDEFFLELTEDD